MAITVGSVYVDILPSAQRFAAEAGTELDPVIKAIGKKIAEQLGRAIGEGISDGVEEGVSDADTGTAAAKQGTKTGGKFAQSFKRTLEAALKDLPEIKLDADTKPALRNVAALREQINKLKADVEVDVDPKKALAGLEKLQRELEFILKSSDVEIDVKMDAAAALRGVEALREEISASLKRSSADAGAFARDLNAKITAAVKALPKIDLNSNSNLSGVQLTLSKIRAQIDELSGKRIGIDIDIDSAVAKAQAQLKRLRTEILNRESIPVDVRLNAEKAAAELQAFINGAVGGQEIEVPVQPAQFGAFETKLRAELAKIAATIRPIEINADTDPARVQIETLRAQLGTLSAHIGIDIPVTEALHDMAAIEVALKALDGQDIDIDVKMDIASVLAQLAAIRVAAAGVGDAADNAGTRAAAGFSRWRLILALIFFLLPVIAGAVVALAGAIAAVATPIAAVALGMDGIKKAVQPLNDEFQKLKEQVSIVFEKGLAPAVADVTKLFPMLTEGLRSTAAEMSFLVQNVVELSTSSKNIDTMTNSFEGLNAMIASLGPATDLFFQNFIDFVAIGVEGIQGFGEEMRQVGESWAEVIANISGESDIGENAVRGFFQVFSELLNLLAPLTEFGAVVGQTFGPALAAAISVVANIFGTLADAIAALPVPLQNIVGAFTILAGTALILGRSIASVGTAMGAALLGAMGRVSAGVVAMGASFTAIQGRIIAAGAAVTGFGVAARVAAPLVAGFTVAAKGLLAILGGPVGIAIIALITILGALGTAQGDAAAAADAHKQAAEDLAQALRDSGGAIDENIVNMTRAKIEALDLGVSLKDMHAQYAGIPSTITELTNVLGGNEQAYQALVAQLDAATSSSINTVGATEQEVAARAAAQAGAIKLKEAIGPLREEFEKAAEKNKLLREAVLQAGNSLLGGVAQAKAYAESITKIGNEMTTTADRANALKNALIILSGGTLPLLEANAKFGDDIAKMGEAFTKFKDAAAATHTPLLNAAGDINLATAEGRAFVSAFSGAFDSMTQAASAAFTAAGGINNLSESVPKAVQKVNDLREAFIKQARDAGLSEAAAKKLADQLGLMPKVAETLFTLKGIPTAQQDLLQLQSKVDALTTKGASFTVNALTAEAQEALRQLGFKIDAIPGTTQTKVTLEDQAAIQKYDQLIRLITTGDGKGPVGLPVGADGKPLLDAIPGMQNLIKGQDPAKAQMPFQPTRAPISGQIIEDTQKAISNQDPTKAALPVGTNTSAVPPAVAGVQQSVQSTVAEMPINPIKGSGWDADLLAIKNSALLTVATMPINPIKGSGWDADILLIRDSVLLTVATMPINPIKGSGWDADLALIKASVAAVPYTQLPIDVVKSINFENQLTLIKASISQPLPPFPAIPVDVVKSINFDTQLNALKMLIGNPQVPYLIPVDVDTSKATQKFNQYVESIRKTIAVFQVDANIQKAVDRLFDFWLGMEKVVAVFGVDADVSLAIQTLDALFQAISQSVVPFTVVAVFGGFAGGLLGGAAGGVASGGGGQPIAGRVGNPGGEGAEVFAGIPDSGPPNLGGGGMTFNPDAPLDTGNIEDLRNALGNFVMHAKGSIDSLTPMNKIASVVPPNTWRVVGDRMTDDEAFIPINNSPRSKSILALTASRMGFGLSPMASGAVQTQSVGAMAPMAATSAQGTYESGTFSGKQANGDTYNFNISNSTANAYELADEALFRLRYQKFGGAYSGRR